MRLGKFAGFAACTTVMLLASPMAEGQTADTRDYDMPAQDLGTALRQVGVARRSVCISGGSALRMAIQLEVTLYVEGDQKADQIRNGADADGNSAN